jgi:DNA mismatch repair protein MutS
LVLLDEIGRGTSTYDGLSLAWACAEMLAMQTRAFTLFASHYFELTLLAEQIDSLANVHLDAVEHKDHIIFMHAVQEGPASRSFGLQVAQLAGVPRAVINRAKQRLAELENQQQPSLLPAQDTAFEHLSLIDQAHPVVDLLQQTDINELSPRQALELLFSLKEQV